MSTLIEHAGGDKPPRKPTAATTTARTSATDLFGPLPAPYPDQPGHQRGSRTSLEAAQAIAPAAPTLRERCLDILKLGNCTADEVADKLEASILSVRPRIAELKSRGLVFDTGNRRKNASGVNAVVWSATVRMGEAVAA
jgi:hypothetical protein